MPSRVDLVDDDGTFVDRANALSVTVDNVVPSIAISGATNVDEGRSYYGLTLGAVSDPGIDTVTSYVVHWGDGSTDTYGTNGVKTHTYADGPNSYNITVDLVDEDGTFLNRANAFSVTVDNVAPSIDVITLSNNSIHEGQSVTVSGMFSDPALGVATEMFSGTALWSDNVSTPLTVNNDGTFSTSRSFPDDNPTLTASDNFTVAITINDDDLGSDTESSSTLTINNVAPANVVINPLVSEYVFAVGGVKTFSTANNFSDLGTLDTHTTAVWTFTHANGLVSEIESRQGTVTQGAGSGSVSNNFSFDEPGVYTVTLTVTDDDTGATTSEPITFVVYDPSEGFVTGGGWINSPLGAYEPIPALTGKATFGFVSKYQKGNNVPTGQTEFQFKVANLNFHSSSYEWLVVSGSRAQYKGVGTINGAGSYEFMLTAIDGKGQGGNEVDKFRIKIWDRVSGGKIYDNQHGDSDDKAPTTELGGGQIVIHKNGNNLTGAPSGAVANGTLLTQPMLNAAVAEAAAGWRAAGVGQQRLAAVSNIDFSFAQFAGATLGVASSSTNKVWLDVDGAGLGWSTDVAAGGYHLVSAVSHEIGHALGFDHDVMGELLGAGEIRLASHDTVNDYGRGLPRLGRFTQNAFTALDSAFEGSEFSRLGVQMLRHGSALNSTGLGKTLKGFDWNGDQQHSPQTLAVDSFFGKLDGQDDGECEVAGESATDPDATTVFSKRNARERLLLVDEAR